MADPILSDKQVALVTSLVQAVPEIGRWIGGLFDGDDVDPAATKRVRDVLPEKSASQAVADELRRRGA